MSGTAFIVAAAGIGYYLYTQQQAGTQELQVAQELAQEQRQENVAGLIEDVKVVEEQENQDDTVLVDDVVYECPAGYVLNGTNCDPTSPPEAPNNNINTGSEIGDAAALTAISLGASAAIEGATSGVKQASSALSESRKAAQAAEKLAQVAKAKDALKVAKAAKVASLSAKAAKATGFISKLKGGPWSFIITAIAQVLIAVLDLNPESFNPCPSGDFDLSSLPDWAKALISAIPILGDLFDLFSPVLCFRGGCPPGLENENGLCYTRCREGFRSNGATLCYKQYPEFESNGMGHTLTSITKKILMDTGRIPDQAPPGTRQSGALYYADPGADYDVVAGVAWQRCPAGMTDTGVRCEGLYTNPAGTIPDA